MGEKAYFVSDLHLGTRLKSGSSDSEKLFLKFLDEISGSAGHLFLLGDIFEFWMEYKYYIPKEYFKVLSQLEQLSKNEIEIHYINGNHDFNLGTFFTREFGIHTHHQPFKIKIQNKNLLLLHGDGMAESDKKYRFMKNVIIHPASNFLFKLLHPDLGMSLAKFTGSRSRKCLYKNLKAEYEKRGSELLTDDVDILIHGHTHSAFIKDLKHGIYINSGNWMESTDYVEMENGTCALKKYPPAP